MTVKKFYKNLQKAFPNSGIFVTVKGFNRLLANPSTALRQCGKMEVIDLINDYDVETNEPVFFIKVKE